VLRRRSARSNAAVRTEPWLLIVDAVELGWCGQ